MFVHTVIMVIEPHMKQGRQHKLISTIFLATSVTKKLDHNMYYPEKNIFTHIDFTKNQYGNDIYQSKYQDSQDGLPIDTYTESRSQHYKIWCIENGAFSIKMWYMLMLVSLDKSYQVLFEEIMN